MNELLLFLHCVGFAIMIGAALYDRFYVVRNIRLARGSSLERDLIRIYLSTSPLFGLGVALILLSGIGLTLSYGEGFFKLSAVGLKQFLFLAIGLAFPLYLMPLMRKINHLLHTVSDVNDRVSETCRSALEQLYLALDVITITSVLILAIAIWKPHWPLAF